MNKKNNVLMHYGVLGMKWGVRKTDPTSPNRLSLKGTTKKGEQMYAVQDKTPKITSFLAKYNINMQKQIANTKDMTLYNKSGQKIGNLQLFHESPTSINIVWLGINKNQRGNGYASAAMKMAEDYARKTGCKQMTLEVPGDSPDARHIYEKQGFKDIGKLTDSSADEIWDGLTCMKKSLDK